ncbi:PspC domain-containing protein [Streptosporangium sp. NPDC051023]|uniref:PspC domain-containing protein n=1 Tax=Streptosporangium sp. NPDC051023 TaxID=3155410 RepID=UPI00344D7F50
MNDTGNAQDPASTPSDSPPFFSQHEERTLSRGEEGRMLTGVCAGLGRYARVDPVLFRVGFAALVLGSGIGVMLYVAAFLLMRETNGGPGYMEQWTRRSFDSETVLALLTGVFAFGLIINVSSEGIGTGTVVVATLFAIALLTAHSRGVDLLAVARSLPDRLRGRRGFGTQQPPAPFAQDAAPGRPSVKEPTPPAQTPLVTEPEPYPGTREHTAEPYRQPTSHPATWERAETFTTAHAAPPPEPPEPPPAPPPPPPPSAPLSAPPQPGTSQTGSASPAGPAQAASYGSATVSFDSSGEPFSPYGPYQPLDPRRRQQPHSPYDLSRYGSPVATAPARKRPRSFVGGITIFLAMIVGGIIVAIQSTSGSVNMTAVGGAMLITVGAGLLVATWFGRGAALVAAGTVIALALVAGSTITGMPRKFGSYRWEPSSLSEAARTYSVGIGEGTLNLSDLSLPPGSRTVFEASVSVGQIEVILPATARVEVNGYTKLGDVKIDHSVAGGADVHHDKILEPEVQPRGDVATIVLNVKAGIGDVEVRRAA